MLMSKLFSNFGLPSAWYAKIAITTGVLQSLPGSFRSNMNNTTADALNMLLERM